MPLCLQPLLPSQRPFFVGLAVPSVSQATVPPRPVREAGPLHLLLGCVDVGLSAWPRGSLPRRVRTRTGDMIVGRDGPCRFLSDLVPHLKKDADCGLKSGLLSLV